MTIASSTGKRFTGSLDECVGFAMDLMAEASLARAKSAGGPDSVSFVMSSGEPVAPDPGDVV